MDADIIIVGGGAAGLMAARELTKAGHRVILLEGQDRLGGRIHTLHNSKNDTDLEFGAEFVHGDLPLTLGLLKEAELAYHKVKGKMWQVNTTSEQPYTEHTNQWEQFEDKLKELKEDMTIIAFLNKYFPSEAYYKLRASVVGYASGYDTADPELASAMALRDEWLEDEGASQYRIDKGYGQVINYLANECGKGNCSIELSSIVKQISYKPGSVTVTTATAKIYRSKKIIITVPPSILIASASEQCGIEFVPNIAEKIAAAKMIGYGAVIKILLQFENAFWKDMHLKGYPGNNMQDLGFAFSSSMIPTWWTQYPKDSGLLTGWLGGPKAAVLKDATDKEILQFALNSLSEIFEIELSVLRQKLIAHHIINWTADPNSMGSYAYATLETEKGQKILNEPVEDTLFFCGEALSTEAEMGTVEAALDSGKRTAEKILALP